MHSGKVPAREEQERYQYQERERFLYQERERFLYQERERFLYRNEDRFSCPKCIYRESALALVSLERLFRCYSPKKTSLKKDSGKSSQELPNSFFHLPE